MKSCTFKCIGDMQKSMDDIMTHWNLDRTSVIRLAVYMLASYTSRPEIRGLSLMELVEYLNERAPEFYPSYGQFVSGRG